MSAPPFQSADLLDAALVGAVVSGVSHWMLMNPARRSVTLARWEMRRVAQSRAAVPPQRGQARAVDSRCRSTGGITSCHRRTTGTGGFALRTQVPPGAWAIGATA